MSWQSEEPHCKPKYPSSPQYQLPLPQSKVSTKVAVMSQDRSLTGELTQPSATSQESSVQAEPSLQLLGVPTQAPAVQASKADVVAVLKDETAPAGGGRRGFVRYLALRQVLVVLQVALSLIATELITNAFKYAYAEAGGRVAVSVVGEAEGRIRLSVCDEGKGLPTGWPDAPTRGTGLGMATAKRLTESQGGQIEVVSPAGGGTTVTGTLSSGQTRTFPDTGYQYSSTGVVKATLTGPASADFDLYHRHHIGRSNRFKVRSRRYVESDLCFFEVKYRNNKGRTIKNRIRKIIEGEDPRKPLSDSKIVAILQREGLMLARRTIAKYREELKIQTSNQRKVLF